MSVESASYISQLDTTLPTAADLISEGDDHLRLTKTVLKTQFPNFGTTAIAASAAEVNYSVGVTSGIQGQLNNKAPTASPTFTGTATLPATTSIGTVSDVEIATLDGVTSSIQTQIDSKGSVAGQAWTGAHSFSGSASVPTLAQGTSTTGAASTAFVQAEWATRLPNYTAPITANSTELNHLVGVTSGVQSQINAKGAIAGQTWTGTHSFPNTTTVGPLTPTIQGYLSTATSDVQAQINSKAAKAGDTYTGAHNFTGATVTVPTLAAGSSGNSAASVDYANALAFASSLPAQTGNSGKFITTNGVTASWSDAIDGNLNLTGTARRITGDFSNATVANRTLFQTRVVNDATDLSIVPNGTSTYAAVSVRSSDSANASVASLSVHEAGGVVELASGRTGTGAYLPIIAVAGGAERLRINPINGNVLATSGALGYGAGAGGTASQTGSRINNVALNRPTGAITLFSGTTTAGSFHSFTLTNSVIEATDNVVVCIASGSTADRYAVSVTAVAAGSCRIQIHNIAAVGVAEAPVLRFAVIKGANA